MTDAAQPTPEEPSPAKPTGSPPTPEAPSQATTTPARKRFLIWLSNQTKQSIVAAVIAGVISLTIALVNDHVQSQETARQSHSEHQVQAMQSLQNIATAQFNTAMAIYKFQTECVGHSNTWRFCAGEAPQFSAFNSDSAEFDTASSNVADQESQQLALQFDTLCTHMFDAPTAAEGYKFMNQVVGIYLELNNHLGQLIRGQ